MTIRSQARAAAADRIFSRAEAQSLADKVTADGKVTIYEKWVLRSVMEEYQDLFTADAAAVIQPLLEPPPPPGPGKPVSLDPSPSQRPVYLAADGSFTIHSTGAAARTPVEKGEALYRAGELIDNAKENVFAHQPEALRTQVLEQLKPTLSTKPPKDFDARQALQARGSSGTILLHLLEASKEPSLKATLLQTYEALVRAEPNQKLKETFIFHLSNSAAAQTGPAKQVADKLLVELAPIAPPYEKWFAKGNDTVQWEYNVGSEFIATFKRNMDDAGWTETKKGSGLYRKSFTEPGIGETKFEVHIRTADETDLLKKVGSKSVHIMAYDGHADWGRNQMHSINNAKTVSDGGAGQLFFTNICVGKSQTDLLKEKFPHLQFATTYGSSSTYTDVDQISKWISQRKGWADIVPFLDETDGHYERNNFVTPISTLVREKVLDRDNDGQADYLDKHFNVSTFAVEEDTAREFRPVKQDRSSDLLDGTKVNICAQVLNTVSEFNAIIKQVNADSRVVADGWFEPKGGETDVVKFEKVPGPNVQAPEYRMKVNARYSHMSEEALRATCVFELNRWLQTSGEQRIDPVDRKILGVIGFAQSLDIDNSWRDDEVFTEFLARYHLPDIQRSDIQPLLDAEHYTYAGNQEMVDAIKAKLSAAELASLKKPEVGEPVRYV